MATELAPVDIQEIDGNGMHVDGDEDFWGEPEFTAKAVLSLRRKWNKEERRVETVVILNVWAQWLEPKWDNTRFKFEAPPTTIFNVTEEYGPDFRIKDMNKVKEDYDKYLLEGIKIPGLDKGLQTIYGPTEEGLINTIKASGDSNGHPFGGQDHPKIQVIFNKIAIEVTDEPLRPNESDPRLLELSLQYI